MERQVIPIQDSRDKFAEFMRYVVVGGLSFVVDMLGLLLGREVLFTHLAPSVDLTLSAALGFILGLLANYVLSNAWVFRREEQQARGRSGRGFVLFTIIGLIGLGLTELGMHLGVSLVGDQSFAYLGVKIVVAALVLIWNYGARKWLIYGE